MPLMKEMKPDVPAYNGGLFGTDPIIHPEGALIEKLGIQDDVLGPVLQHLLVDISEDGVPGPVDFRSLSVREFGTIYEGLLESSLSVANLDLSVDTKGIWIPASKSDKVIINSGMYISISHPENEKLQDHISLQVSLLTISWIAH